MEGSEVPEKRTNNSSARVTEAEPRRFRGNITGIAFGCILLVYVALTLRFLCILPLWGAVHDEPLHFGYCKYLAVRGHLPLIGDGIYMDPRLYYTEPSAGEASHHPPGYYFPGSLVYRCFQHSSLATQNYALRGMSLAFGFVSLLFLWGFCREVAPDKPSLSLAAVAGVAVFPHFLMMSSVIYVETFGALSAMGALWMLSRYARDHERRGSLVAAGAFIGGMALTKMTLLAFCLALVWIGLALTCQAPVSRRCKLKRVAAFLAALAIVSGWWYLRNLMVYGQLFPTSVQPGQLESAIKVGGRPADMMTLLFIPAGRFYYRLAVTGIFKFFWCPIDWIPSSLRPFMYSIASLTWLLTLVGLWKGIARGDEYFRWFWKRFVLPILGGLVLVLFLYLRWTVTTAIQAQAEFGKFVMPVFGFCSLLSVVAMDAWLGTRRALILIGSFIVFFLVWDLVAIHHIATVLIPQHASTYPIPR